MNLTQQGNLHQQLQQLQRLLALQSNPNGLLTVKEATERYLSERQLRPLSLVAYRAAYEASLKHLADVPLNAVTRDQIVSAFKKTRGRQMANLAICLLRGTFNHLEVVAPLSKFPRHLMKPRDRMLPRELLPALWTAVGKMTLDTHLALTFLLGYGLRRNEVRGLLWDDFTDTQFRVREPKNGRDLILPITPKLRAALPEPRGKFVCPKGLKKNALAKLRIELQYAWSAHDLRRTFATTAVEIGINAYLVKALLNHASGDVTGIHYVRPSMAAKLAALEQIQQVVL